MKKMMMVMAMLIPVCSDGFFVEEEECVGERRERNWKKRKGHEEMATKHVREATSPFSRRDETESAFVIVIQAMTVYKNRRNRRKQNINWVFENVKAICFMCMCICDVYTL